MLAIGRALMTNPRLLLLDEASEGLAPRIRAEIWRVLAMLKAGGQAILVVDKNIAPLLRLADRHYILERGRTEFLRALGIEHRGIFGNGRADGIHFVVRAITIEFLKPALMDDELCVETHPSAKGGASIDMMQKIRPGGEVLLTAKVRIAVVAGGKAKRIFIPREVVRSVQPASQY